MYTVMVDYLEGTRRYPRKVGKVTNKLTNAIRRAQAKDGYVMCGLKVVWC